MRFRRTSSWLVTAGLVLSSIGVAAGAAKAAPPPAAAEAGTPVVRFTPDGDQAIPVGRTLRYVGEAFDPDGSRVSYEWYLSGEGPLSTTQYFSPTFDVEGTFELELRVTDGQGQQGSKKITVVVRDFKPPIADFTPGQDVYTLIGDDITFDASASKDPDGGDLTYAWRSTGKDGIVSQTSTYRRVFNEVGRFGVELTVTDDEGESAVKHINVWVDRGKPPVAGFIPDSDQQILVGETLQFIGDQSVDPDGGDLSWAWFSTGLPGSQSNTSTFSRTFDEPGTYEVEMLVTDNEGDEASKKITVVVSDPAAPIADFSPGVDQTVKLGATLDFDGAASNDPDGGEVTYEWRSTGVPDVASRTSTYSRSFDEPGHFDVELTVTDDEGEQATKKIDVFVPASPVASFRPGEDVYVVEGEYIRFDGTDSYDPDGGELTYEWRSTGLGVVSRTDSYETTFKKVGRVGVELVVTDDEGQMDTKHINVWVRTAVPPVIEMEPNTDQQILVGQTLWFIADQSYDPDGGELTYEWYSSGLVGPVERIPRYSRTFTEPGDYEVELRVIDDEGVQATKTIKVLVSKPAPPVAEFTPGVTRRVSVGQRFTFDGSASNDPDGGELTYEWRSTGVPDIPSRTSSYTRSFDTVGRVGVELTVIDDEGQVAKKHINLWVTEPSPPIATFTPGEDQYVKVGDSLSFDGSASNDPDGGELTYEWRSTGIPVIASQTNSYTRTFDAAGRVGVELTVIDDEGKVTKKHINVWVS